VLATTITKKGQVTIPKEIREALGLKERDKMIFTIRDEGVLMRPLHGSLLDLRGTVQPKARPENFEEVRRKVKGEIGKKIAEDLQHG
jgi:AbrB family looped-hinge helix DNA binding protein